MYSTHKHEVRFDIWCPYCIHKDELPTKDPCNECLTQGWNVDSRKPILWEGDLDEAIESQKAENRSRIDDR